MSNMYYARTGQTADAILASAKADRNAIAAEFPPPGVAARPEIMTWQGKLRQLGLLQPLSDGRFMTGFEGPRTRAATRAFEQAAGGAVAFRGNGLYKPSYDAIAETRLRTGTYPTPQPLPVLPGTTNGGGGGFIPMFPTRPDGTLGPSTPTPAPGGPIAAPAPGGPIAETPLGPPNNAVPVGPSPTALVVGGLAAIGLTWAAFRYARTRR